MTDCDRYYTDPDMLERIPLMFLLLGAIYAVLGLVAVVMITEPEDSLSESNSVQETENTSEEDGSLRPLEVLRTSTFYQVELYNRDNPSHFSVDLDRLLCCWTL